MRKDKLQAFKLRKEGKGYKEIRDILGIPKSTLSGWFGSIRWSRNIKEKLIEKSKKTSTFRILKLNKIRGRRLAKIYKQARKEAKEDFIRLKFNPLFIIGLVIYWGEGDKLTKHQVRVANIDPKMIKLFVNFLIKICKVDKKKICIWLLLYPDLNLEKCLKFWQRHSGLISRNFRKTIYITGRHKKRKVSLGVCNILVNSSYLKEKMLEWLKMMHYYIA